MISMRDIYFKIDFNLVSQKFWEVNIEDQKKLIDLELKKYIISKIQELNGSKTISSECVIDLSVEKLLTILATNIPQEEHFDTLRHFTHYIIKVAGGLQSWSIVWWQEDEIELISSPLVEFDDTGLWTDLFTHEKTDYVQTFSFVYDIFNNKFMTKSSPQKLVMGLSKNEG